MGDIDEHALSRLCDLILEYATRLAESRELPYTYAVIALDIARYRIMRDIDDGK